jgi:hypothetical protein
MAATPLASPVPPAPRAGRSRWHRLVGIIPLAYLGAIVVVGSLHPFLPQWRWLLIHLLLLGAATNAILVWSTHFAQAVLRSPLPATRRGEVARLVVLNTGVVGVLVAGVTGPAWLAVPASALVFAAVAAHLAVLAVRLRRALPAPFTVTVHYYLAAGMALLVGVPAGGWMMVVADTAGLHLFHAHINVLGWISLTVLGTVLTLWPTVLRTRMAAGAVRAARRALPLAAGGLVSLAVGVLIWWPVLAVAGLALFAAAVIVIAVPAVAAARTRPPSSFAAWSIAAAMGWLLVALVVDAVILLAADSPEVAAARFGAVLVPLLAGFVAQVLIGALGYLLPTVLGGGPARVRARTAVMERHWPQRVVMGNAALAAFLLSTGPYVRIATSLLVLAALVQFLVAAVRVLMLRGGDHVGHDSGRDTAGQDGAAVPN